MQGNTVNIMRMNIFLIDKNTYCISIILPDIPEGARLSWLRHAALRFLKPKKRERRGEADPRLCASENDACE
jgi:hypothetical protein